MLTIMRQIGVAPLMGLWYYLWFDDFPILPESRLTISEEVVLMTIQYFKSLRDLNRFLKTTPVDLPATRLNEIRTRAKKRKPTAFMV